MGEVLGPITSQEGSLSRPEELRTDLSRPEMLRINDELTPRRPGHPAASQARLLCSTGCHLILASIADGGAVIRSSLSAPKETQDKGLTVAPLNIPKCLLGP